MENGFLPREQPLDSLDDPYYEPWERLGRNLAVLLESRTLRKHVLEMPLLNTERLRGPREMQRAYVLLSFFTQAWIWQRPEPCERLPPVLSKPYLAVCEALDMVPTATFAAYCLWNWRLKDEVAAMRPENLSTNVSFTGLADESWFFSISTAIEWLGAQLLHDTMPFVERIQQLSLVEILSCAKIITGRVQEIQAMLLRMREGCDPEIFYWKLRPWLAGSVNMESAGLPHGVIYEQHDEIPQYRTFSGGSNAQSSLLQYIDALIGQEDGDSHSGDFMQAMLRYMPPTHRAFLHRIKSGPSLLDACHRLAETCPSGSTAAMQAVLESKKAMHELRSHHLRIVVQYIVIPQGRQKQDSRGERAGTTVKGTGGSDPMALLKESRGSRGPQWIG